MSQCLPNNKKKRIAKAHFEVIWRSWRWGKEAFSRVADRTKMRVVWILCIYPKSNIRLKHKRNHVIYMFMRICVRSIYWSFAHLFAPSSCVCSSTRVCHATSVGWNSVTSRNIHTYHNYGIILLLIIFCVCVKLCVSHDKCVFCYLTKPSGTPRNANSDDKPTKHETILKSQTVPSRRYTTNGILTKRTSIHTHTPHKNPNKHKPVVFTMFYGHAPNGL